MKKIILMIFTVAIRITLIAQNVGINTSTPEGKLHIKGSADASQLVIDAHSIQSNINPLIKLRNSSGYDMMWIHSDDASNTFLGFNAGTSNNMNLGGRFNSFVGSYSGYKNTVGDYNTTLGWAALYSNTSGRNNTSVGIASLSFNSTASENTAIGSNTLSAQFFTNVNNLWVSANTAIGFDALRLNSPTSTSNGIYNTAIGHSSLRSNTTGYSNTAIGYYSLYSNATGIQNTATGQGALYTNNGSLNTATGYGALSGNTTASENTAIGYEALSTQSFSNNSNAWISGNVAVGNKALFNTNSTSINNGINNTAVGHSALLGNTIGFSNVAVGVAALYNTNTANANTGIGQGALYYNIGGNQNTGMGYNAGPTVSNPYSINSTAIGANTAYTSFDQVRIGNAVLSIGGPQNWTNTSDRRIKLNILEDVPGLSFINLLRPVTYNKSIQKEDEIIGRKEPAKIHSESLYEKTRYTGFIAQEVELAAKQIGYGFSGVDAPKNEHDLYGLRYAEFVVPLVKAVQEQQSIIEQQNKKIDFLLKEMQILRDKIK